MAVTVTKAAPSLTISDSVAHNRQITASIIGAYGLSGASIFSAITGDQFCANKRIRVVKLTLSGTYVTGGFALAASDYGLKEIHALMVLANSTSASVPLSGGSTPALDISSSVSAPTVRLYSDTATEFTNGGSVTNFVFYAVLVGI